jgi:hypothetical protein
MRVAVVAIEGMFDSGLATIMDVLGAANALSVGGGPLISRWVSGRRSR